MDALVDALKYARESGKFAEVLRDNPSGSVRGSVNSVEEAQELIDALKSGDFKVQGIVVIEDDDCDSCEGCNHCEDCDDECKRERMEADKERFKTLVDGLICRFLHDNDSACCIFQTWRAERYGIKRVAERVDSGRMTEDEAEKKIKLLKHSLALFERTFMNAFLGEYYDLVEPMPLRSDELNEVVKQRFERNYRMIEDES